MEQADAFVALQDEAYDTRELAYTGLGRSVGWNMLSELQREETAYAVFPVPDQEGGVIAAVTTYAAINRNTPRRPSPSLSSCSGRSWPPSPAWRWTGTTTVPLSGTGPTLDFFTPSP